MPIRNYDDLRPDNLAIPRILAIVNVPPGNDPEEWLDHHPDRLCLRSTAFWLSLFGYKATSNEVKVTVRIPTDQKLTAEALRAMVVKIGNGDRP